MRTPGLAILRLILQNPRGAGEGTGDADHSHAERVAADAQSLRGWSRRWSGAGVVLIVLCLTVFLPGLWSLQPVDRDEARFAQASRQMYESGDYIVPRIQDRPRLNKPPLIYWLQSASVAVFGDAPGQYANGNIWVFRLPSVLCAIASVLLTWRLGMRMMDARAAALGAALLAVCPMVAWDAHQARADQLLLLTVVAAQFALLVCWRRARRGQRVPALAWIGFWGAMGLGVLAKGPITPMIAALTCAALCWQTRSSRWLLALRPLPGVLIVIALVAPWIVAVGMREGWDVYVRTVFDETLGRSAGAKEGHWGPPGYHLVLLCVLFWPGVLMTGLALRRGWRRRRADGPLFLLAWIVPAWVVFELVSTKLPHYTMPLYPAIALLSGRAVLAAASGRLVGLREWGTRIGFAIWGLVAVGILLAGVALLSLLSRFDDVNDAAMITSLWYLMIGFVLIKVFKSMWAGRWVQAQLRSMIAAVLMLVLLFQTLAPAANQMSTRIAKETVNPDAIIDIAAIGYHEDSLIFLTRGRAERLELSQLPGWLEHRTAAFVVSRVPPEPFVPLSLSLMVTEITGLNYSRGRVEVVEVWVVKSE